MISPPRRPPRLLPATMDDLLDAASQRDSSPHTLPGLISQRDGWRAECAAKTKSLLETQFMLSFQKGQFRRVASEAAALARRRAYEKQQAQWEDVKHLYEMGYSSQQLTSDIEVIQQEILHMTDENTLEAARYWLPIYLHALERTRQDEEYAAYEKAQAEQYAANEAYAASSEYYAHCNKSSYAKELDAYYHIMRLPGNC